MNIAGSNLDHMFLINNPNLENKNWLMNFQADPFKVD